MDLRCIFLSLCIVPLTFFAQVFQFNQNLHQAPTTDIIDFGYRPAPVGTKNGFIKRLDKSYLGQYTDSNNAFIAATPLCGFSVGVENDESAIRYQNSRGLMVLGGYRKFKCHGFLVENQAVFNTFQREFIMQHGEYYPTATGYNQQNGMIPGMGRTKPFHGDGFDFAFSQGGFEWGVSNTLTLFGGNQSIDFCPGIRSVFWSQHNQALMAGGTLRLGKHFTYVVTRARLYDLIRKPIYANVESPYYKKNFGLHAMFLTLKKHRVGLIYQTIWQAGDSLKEKAVNPMYWVPIPGLDRTVKQGVSMPQIGLNYSWNLHESTLLYGELFSRGFIKNAWAAQLGITYYSKLTSNLTLSSSLAWLQTGTGFYGTHYAQNFTHQNLPLGTLLGNGAQEFLLTARIGYRRFFMDYLFHLSTMKNGIQPLLIQTYIRPEQIIQHRIDLGFMASNIMQLELFLGITLRQAVGFKECNAISFGLRTAIFKPNHVY
jgi:hypothetical protein